MDNLKKYLQQHTDEMDIDAPAADVWKQIEKAGVKKGPGKLTSFTIRFAAAAAVLAAVVLAAIKITGTEDRSIIIVKNDTAAPLSEKIIANSGTPIVSPIVSTTLQDTIAPPLQAVAKKSKPVDKRYAMMESFKENYGQLVSYQMSSIRATPVYAENPAYFDDFKIRLKQMDLDELAIRNNIRRRGISNVLLEQLINVYQQKLDVLKSLQAEINKMNTRVKENTTTDSLSKYYLNI